MANNQPAHRGNGSLPSEDTIKELLAVQKQEISLRLKEVERDRDEIDLNKSVAQKSIDAQERDRKHEREEGTKRQKTHQNFVFFVVVALLAFAGFAMYIGKETIVLDLFKVLVGFVGGMGYQAFQNAKRNSDD